MAPGLANILAQLCNGTWLDRRLVRVAAAALLVIQLAVFAFMVGGTHGWIVPLAAPTTTDFVSFYAAGSLANAATPELAYNLAAHAAAEQAATEPGIPYIHFNYPPVYLLLCALVARLPYLMAFALFETAGVILYLCLARRVLDDRSGTALLALAAFPLVFWTVGDGQNGLLTAGLFGAATLLIDRRPIVAGLLFGALCYKPQFGLLVPFALAAAGRWSSFGAAALSAGALVLASLALFGVDTWRDFFLTAGASHAMYESGHIPFYTFANLFGAVRQLGGSVPLAYGAQGMATLVAAALVAVIWRRGLSLPTRAAILAGATPIAVPMSLYYDLMLGVIAGAWLVRDRASTAAAGWETTALACLFLVLLDGRQLAENWQLPVFPLAAIALLAIVSARAWREIAGQAGAGERSLRSIAWRRA